jgi:hypothetical protein
METLTWEALEKHLGTGNPWILGMGGRRGVRIGFDAVDGRLFVRLPAAPTETLEPAGLAEITTRILAEGQTHVLEVATSTPRFYREFHRFAGLLAEDFNDPSKTASGAFESALKRWRDFTSVVLALTSDQQIGLVGEMLFLRALIEHDGQKRFDTWVASDPGGKSRHDFRLGSTDIEVKATMGRTRRHYIHGLDQMMPALDHALFILSIRLDEGTGQTNPTLPHLVAWLRNACENSQAQLTRFEATLDSVNYSDSDAPRYTKRYILADEPRLIRVDESTPRITKDVIANVLTEQLAARIDKVTYRVDFEGMGHPMGSSHFDKVLPGVRVRTE